MTISEDEGQMRDSDGLKGRNSGSMSWWIKFTIFVLGMMIVMTIIWVNSLGPI